MIQDRREKRTYPRFQINCPVSFFSFDQLGIAETLDLSLGGMKIRSRCMLFINETYDFMIIVGGRAISPKGRVLRIENQLEFNYEAGVSFLDLIDHHRNQLNGFLSALL
ncbi:MAG: hypothetical protein GTN74_12085 [Proteobacteria bacterium]|nr:hypothetical protein [Pseudomonadota bacterium]